MVALFLVLGMARPMGEVEKLADQLVQAAGVVRAQAENEIGDFYRAGDDERAAMQSLRRLERMAMRFQEGREDFDGLMRSYSHAAGAVEVLRNRAGVYRAFRNVQELMDRLAPYYSN